MGWLPWNWGSDSTEDALRDLDPALKEFLRKQGPPKYPKQAAPEVTSAPEEQYTTQLGIQPGSGKSPERQQQELDARKAAGTTERDDDGDWPLPKESLFQDGRYKHLWKTYRPHQETVQAGKSDQEKLMDIVYSYKERQAMVGKAAQENCSDEQFNLHECFRTGGWKSRMTMCREENKSLNRCVTMQTRFLRALGYMSIFERTKEFEERIQMHADTLYHRMLDQENVMLAAKEKGEPIPQFRPLFDTAGDPLAVNPSKGVVTLETLPPEEQEKQRRKRLVGLSGPALDLAKAELDADMAIAQAMDRRLAEHYWEDYQGREGRRKAGVERMSDKVKRWFDMREYPEENPFKDNPQGLPVDGAIGPQMGSDSKS